MDIDHVVINHNLLWAISDASVNYGLVSSDHRPVFFSLAADVASTAQTSQTNEDSIENITVSNWEACSSSDISKYASGLDQLLQSVCLPPICCVKKCSNSDHRGDVSNYSESICECISAAMHRFIPSTRVHVNNYSVAGWNDLVADKHEAARRAFLDWVSTGKSRTGYICEQMKRTRAQFKLALRYCRSNEELLRSDAMAKNDLTNQSKFWRNVKH